MAMLVAFFLSQIHYLHAPAWTDAVATFQPLRNIISDVYKTAPEQHKFVVYKIICCP